MDGGGFEMETVAVIKLLLVSGSYVVELTFAVFEVEVPLETLQATLRNAVNSSSESVPTDGLVHVTTPVLPTAGVEQFQPVIALSDWKVMLGGNWSVMTTS